MGGGSSGLSERTLRRLSPGLGLSGLVSPDLSHHGPPRPTAPPLPSPRLSCLACGFPLATAFHPLTPGHCDDVGEVPTGWNEFEEAWLWGGPIWVVLATAVDRHGDALKVGGRGRAR